MEITNKRIFKYNNGIKDVYVDPSEIDYQIIRNSEGEDLDAIWDMIESETDPDGNPIPPDDRKQKLQVIGCHQIEPIIRKSFGIPPFDPDTGEGMTQDEVLDIYANFSIWRMNIKKNIEESPTSVTTTDSPNDSSRLNSEKDITMNVNMDSSSIPEGSSRSSVPSSSE